MLRLSGMQKARKHPRIGNDRKGAFITVRYKRQEPIGSVRLPDCFLLYGWLKIMLGGIEPHLDESHRLVREVVNLRVPHAAAHGRVLHPSFLENVAFAAFVGMPEFTAGNG